MSHAALLSSLVLTLLAVQSQAGGVEVALHLGRTMPTFEQTFTYDPSSVIPSAPGLTITPRGALRLDARGALSFSGGVTWFFAGPVGLEARVDGLTADLEATGARYDVNLQLPAPLPAVTGQLELGSRDLALESVRPVSLNLRVLTPGPVRLSLSGGVSRLGPLRLAGSLTGAVTAGTAGATIPGLGVEVALKAEAPPADIDRDQYGVNLGLGVQIGLGRNLSLSGETRGFLFRERTLSWSSAASPRNALEDALQHELLARLEPVRFTPTFFAVNAGLALRF